MGEKIIQKPGKYFTEGERHKIIEEWISSKCQKKEIWEKYTGEKEEHGNLIRWMRQLGYDAETIELAFQNPRMQKREMLVKDKSSEEKTFENLQLEKRITELEKQLKEAELKAIAYSTMVDMAEKEFKIPIRKKFNTKP